MFPLIYLHIKPYGRFEALMAKKTPQVLRLKITLEHVDPAPWRELEIRSDKTLPHLHDAIQAKLIEGRSPTEIAREMGISRGTVYKAKSQMSSGHNGNGVAAS